MESKTYQKAETMTDRMDYLFSLGNNLVYSLALEKLMDLPVPPRADAIRVILTELQRIQSHLIWIGTSAMDLGAMSVFLYAMREREMILDIFELVSGQRMMTTYIRPGGLWRDVPAQFNELVQQVVDIMPGRIDEYETLLTNNVLFKERTQGIGVIDIPTCLAYNVSGPTLRAAGLALDVRKSNPYSGIEQYDFEIPTQTTGDVYGRYMVRVAEMRESVKIIKQALDKMPFGPTRTYNPKYIPPFRSEIGVSMESLIHHFKLWTEGFTPPAGSVYTSIESPRVSWACSLNLMAHPNRTGFITVPRPSH